VSGPPGRRPSLRQAPVCSPRDAEATRTFTARACKPFRAKSILVCSFQPHGSRTLIRASLNQVTRVQLRGLLGKQSTPGRWDRPEPPGPKPGFPIARCRCPFLLADSRASVILLTSPDLRDTCCRVTWGSRHGRTRYAGDPCAYGCAEPPNLLLLYVGNPGIRTRSAQPGLCKSGLQA